MTLDQLKALYAPYHNFRSFEVGFREYDFISVSSRFTNLNASAQAYDRGAECAMRWARYRREGKA
jgi:hypothetical protein